MNPICKNLECQQLLSNYDLSKLEKSGRPEQSKHKFCGRCRRMLGGYNFMSIQCNGCPRILKVERFSQSTCKVCKDRNTIFRNNSRNLNVPTIARKIIMFLNSNGVTTKDSIKKKFGLSEDSFKQHMAILNKQEKTKRIISYSLEEKK